MSVRDELVRESIEHTPKGILPDRKGGSGMKRGGLKALYCVMKELRGLRARGVGEAVLWIDPNAECEIVVGVYGSCGAVKFRFSGNKVREVARQWLLELFRDVRYILVWGGSSVKYVNAMERWITNGWVSFYVGAGKEGKTEILREARFYEGDSEICEVGRHTLYGTMYEKLVGRMMKIIRRVACKQRKEV